MKEKKSASATTNYLQFFALLYQIWRRNEQEKTKSIDKK